MSAEVTTDRNNMAEHLEAIALYLDSQTVRLLESGSDGQGECCEKIVAELTVALREDGFLRILLESLDGKGHSLLPTSLSDMQLPTDMSFSNIFPKILMKSGNSLTLAPAVGAKVRNLSIRNGNESWLMSISFVAEYTARLCRALVSRLQNESLGEQEINGINNFIRDLVAAVQRLDGVDFPAEPRKWDTCEVELGEMISPAQSFPSGKDASYGAHFKGVTPASGVWRQDGTVSIDWSAAQDAYRRKPVKRAAIQSVNPIVARALVP